MAVDRKNGMHNLFSLGVIFMTRWMRKVRTVFFRSSADFFFRSQLYSHARDQVRAVDVKEKPKEENQTAAIVDIIYKHNPLASFV